MPPGGMPGPGGARTAPLPRVEHALVDLPDTEKKLTDLFNKRTAEGWEFAGQVGQMSPGGYLKLAFKRPLPKVATGGGAAAGPAMVPPAMGGMVGPGEMPGPGMSGPGGPAAVVPGLPGMGMPGGPPMAGGSAPKIVGIGGMEGGGGPAAGPMVPGGGPVFPAAPPAEQFAVLKLKTASASDVAKVLVQAFGEGQVRLIAENKTNSLLVISASDKTMATIRALVEVFDQPPAGGRPGVKQ